MLRHLILTIISCQDDLMNMSRFAELMNRDVRWWICMSLRYVLSKKTLIGFTKHKMYYNIAENHEEHKLIFLDAAIILYCLKERSKSSHVITLQHDIENLINCIEHELDREEKMMHEEPMTIGKYSENDPMIAATYERYVDARMFTDDPYVKGIRMRKP